MLITDKKELTRFSAPHRLWQGIPGIEVTKKGRIFATFYSGGTREQFGNFAMVVVSDDGGATFSEPIAVAYEDEARCFDPMLWIDPMGRLWFTWSCSSRTKGSMVWGSVCDDPDADTLVFGDVFPIGKYVMMNKPTVLSTGEWLFPVAVWDSSIKIDGLPPEEYGQPIEEGGAFVYKKADDGFTFEKRGGVVAPERSCDEQMVVELSDGRLWMLIRAKYGIASSYSHDKGHTWTDARDSGIPCPCTRFHIRRLRSGRLLLVNHYDFDGRNNLTALLSEDEGKTWPYKLLFDGRMNVSYPDAVEADDGYIYITYDRERGGFGKSLEGVLSAAREILYARVTEDDILAGKLISEGSRLGCIISKLGEYVDGDPFAQEKGETVGPAGQNG